MVQCDAIQNGYSTRTQNRWFHAAAQRELDSWDWLCNNRLGMAMSWVIDSGYPDVGRAASANMRAIE